MSVPATLEPAAAQAGASPPKLTLKRIAAMLVLPASLLPVVLLGPGVLRAPRKLIRQAAADVERLEQRLAPARARPPAPPRLYARISFGGLYGPWRTFPAAGRSGLIPLGPEQ